MSTGVNRTILIGRLTRDPELRHTQSGQPVTNMTLAIPESWKSKDGQAHEKVEYIRISVWGRSAEHCGKFLTKGRLVFVEGKLNSRKWTDKNGTEHQSVEVTAQVVHFLDRAADSRPAENGSDQTSYHANGSHQSHLGGAGDDDMSDVPF